MRQKLEEKDRMILEWHIGVEGFFFFPVFSRVRARLVADRDLRKMKRWSDFWMTNVGCNNWARFNPFGPVPNKKGCSNIERRFPRYEPKYLV